MEIRFVKGRFLESGEAIAWFRLRHPLVGGHPVHPLETVAAAGDFGNGIAAVLDWDRYLFINPDLTLYVERPPVDEWVALESQTRIEAGSVGVAESVLWDRRGRIGRAIQSLVIGPRPPARRLLEPERLDPHVVLLRVAGVDAVGQRLDE